MFKGFISQHKKVYLKLPSVYIISKTSHTVSFLTAARVIAALPPLDPQQRSSSGSAEAIADPGASIIITWLW